MDSAKARERGGMGEREGGGEEGRRGKEEQRGWKQGGSSAQTDSVIVHTVPPSVFFFSPTRLTVGLWLKYTAAIPNVTSALK